MPKSAFILQYDGSGFYGFQRQKKAKTIQQILEDALYVILKEKVIVEAAGRTDTGVHAKGMVISMATVQPISNYYTLHKSINALTPVGMGVIAGCEVPGAFHAQFSCKEREYEYYFLNSDYMLPLYFGRVCWIKRKLNLERISKELSMLIGSHDFSSLSKTASLQYRSSTIREIKEARVEPVPGTKGLYKIVIRANSFLHNMIRVIVGTIFDLALGKLGETNILEIIQKADRREAGKTLPPDGLYFIKGYYPEYPQIEKMYETCLGNVCLG